MMELLKFLGVRYVHNEKLTGVDEHANVIRVPLHGVHVSVCGATDIRLQPILSGPVVFPVESTEYVVFGVYLLNKNTSNCRLKIYADIPRTCGNISALIRAFLA